MTNSIHGRRIRRRRIRRPLSLAAFFFCVGLCLLFGVFEQSAQSPRVAGIIRTVPDSYSFADYTVPISKEANSERVAYPYSVIRGGAHDRGELVSEIRRDPVVAAHYADFSAAAAQVVRVRDDKFAYVSYRIDDKIFWTSKKVRLARGEQLITDGKNLARTRCGNRVSVEPKQPTSTVEPAPEVFETPIIPINADLFASDTVPAAEALQLPENFVSPLPPLPDLVNPPSMLTLEDRFFWEEFFPYSPSGNFSPALIFSTQEEQPNLPGVPEPGTLILLASGLAAQILFKRIASKK
jgi:hypothetical protein